MKKVAAIVGVLVIALALAACGGSSSGGSSGEKSFTVKGTDAFAFAPAEIPVNKGDTVNITFQNTGAAVHDFVIAAYNVKIVAEPGKTGTAKFKADKAGTFDILCIQPGHKEAGMKGKLVVKG